MHPRNRHQERYDLKELARVSPGLLPFIIINKYGDESIDFSNSMAVKALNQAILKSNYQINFWDIPSDFLCPPIPGRADYIHSAADLFAVPQNLKVLDIGTGANCIYPLLGQAEYGWKFVASDINLEALKNAQLIVSKNELNKSIELRLQKDTSRIFTGIIGEGEKFDLTICNPPFHESKEEAMSGNRRKWKNLGKGKVSSNLNFGGQDAELWYPGGERCFIKQMIDESVSFKDQVIWFSTLVSKDDNLVSLKKGLMKSGILSKVIDMSQGQKKSRILCWTFN
jgi:23S rRNA (adenine1618-N6)-methyltransferase